MLIDCNTCTQRDLACSDCVVTHFLALPAELGSGEREALAVLHEAGFVPPVRMSSQAIRTPLRQGHG